MLGGKSGMLFALLFTLFIFLICSAPDSFWIWQLPSALWYPRWSMENVLCNLLFLFHLFFFFHLPSLSVNPLFSKGPLVTHKSHSKHFLYFVSHWGFAGGFQMCCDLCLAFSSHRTMLWEVRLLCAALDRKTVCLSARITSGSLCDIDPHCDGSPLCLVWWLSLSAKGLA